MGQTHTQADRGACRRGTDSAVGAVPLLSFERVSKSYPDGRQWIPVLEQVSFEVHDGEHVGIFGSRRAGKSTLLRLAAGIEAPDDGRIAFEGRDLAKMPALQRDRLLRDRIGLLASDDWRPAKGERVVDHVALPLVSDGATMHEARRRARQTLHWAGATRLCRRAGRFARCGRANAGDACAGAGAQAAIAAGRRAGRRAQPERARRSVRAVAAAARASTRRRS